MAKDTVFTSKKSIGVKGKIYDLSTPQIMAILNITPDSFYDGGRYLPEEKMLNRVEKVLHEGALIVDVGGFSSRPGHVVISEETELSRVLPVIKSIRKNFSDILISVDTFRKEVAEKCIEEGASIINDISGGRWEPGIFTTCARNQVSCILMHSRNTLQKMHEATTYDTIADDVKDELNEQAEKAKESGLENIIIDPGFGFSKNIDQNFELFGQLEKICNDPLPVLVGISRKSMIWKTGNTTPEKALNGTTALHMAALIKGANILRVHDVKEAKETITLFQKITNHG